MNCTAMSETSPAAPNDLVPLRILRTMQIIAAALILAVLAFGAIAVRIVQVQRHGHGIQPAVDEPVLTMVAFAALIAAVVASMLVPMFMVRRAVRDISMGKWKDLPQNQPTPDVDSIAIKLLTVKQTAMIVGSAQLEGSGFLACLAYLIEGEPLALSAAIVAVALMVVRFPTRQRLQAWLVRRAAEIDRLRQSTSFEAK